jgi:hypothetical protein
MLKNIAEVKIVGKLLIGGRCKMDWGKRWKKKVKEENKRRVRIKGIEGWFVIVGESLTGATVKVKRIGCSESFYVKPDDILLRDK